VREIGIHMAIGAKPRHVLTQFTARAVVMCLVGGLVGVCGVAGVWGVNHRRDWATSRRMSDRSPTLAV
jgi:putative ABC transport system permease protein